MLIIVSQWSHGMAKLSFLLMQNLLMAISCVNNYFIRFYDAFRDSIFYKRNSLLASHLDLSCQESPFIGNDSTISRKTILLPINDFLSPTWLMMFMKFHQKFNNLVDFQNIIYRGYFQSRCWHSVYHTLCWFLHYGKASPILNSFHS